MYLALLPRTWARTVPQKVSPACKLEPTFSIQMGNASVLPADLVAVGFPGAQNILTGPLGFSASHSPKAGHRAATGDEGGDWAILEIGFKPFAACRHTHPAIGAALTIAQTVSAADIARIDAYPDQATQKFCDRPVCSTPDDTRFSPQHAVAAAFVKDVPGGARGVEQNMLSVEPDEAAKTTLRTRLIRFQPEIVAPNFVLHDDREAVYPISGKLVNGCDASGAQGTEFAAPSCACRPPGTPHGPFTSKDGCVFLEIQHYMGAADGS